MKKNSIPLLAVAFFVLGGTVALAANEPAWWRAERMAVQQEREANVRAAQGAEPGRRERLAQYYETLFRRRQDALEALIRDNPMATLGDWMAERDRVSQEVMREFLN